MNDIPIAELLRVCQEAGVFKRMSSGRCRKVIVDYCPPRDAVVVPRESDEDEPVQPIAPEITTITYTLEDAMFGGIIFVALTCGSRVIINPFAWVSYEHLGTLTIDRR